MFFFLFENQKESSKWQKIWEPRGKGQTETNYINKEDIIKLLQLQTQQ